MFWNVSVKLKLHVECAEKSIQRPSPKLAVYYLFSTTICSKLGAYLFYTKTLWHHPSLSSLPPFGHAFLSIKPRGFLEQLHAASAAALKKAVESEASDVESLGFDEEASPEATGSLVLDGWCLLSGWISDKRKCWPVFFPGKTVGLLILFSDDWCFFPEIWRFERFEYRLAPETAWRGERRGSPQSPKAQPKKIGHSKEMRVDDWMLINILDFFFFSLNQGDDVHTSSLEKCLRLWVLQMSGVTRPLGKWIVSWGAP